MVSGFVSKELLVSVRSREVLQKGACRRRLARVVVGGGGGIRRRAFIRVWALSRGNGWFVVDLRVTYSKQMT